MGLKAAGAGPQSYSKRYIALASNCRVARRDVTRILGIWQMPELVDAAQQVVSELMAGVVKHAAAVQGLPGAMDMRVTRTTHGVIVEVSDPLTSAPVVTVATPTDESGRGMYLIAQLSASWGFTPARDGRTLRVDLAR